jgi:hypothetical protein
MGLHKPIQQRKASMNKFTHLGEFLGTLIDDRAVLEKAQKVVQGIMQAGSPRLSEISRVMSGNEAANYKCIQRLLQESEPRDILLRLYQETAAFITMKLLHAIVTTFKPLPKSRNCWVKSPWYWIVNSVIWN